MKKIVFFYSFVLFLTTNLKGQGYTSEYGKYDGPEIMEKVLLGNEQPPFLQVDLADYQEDMTTHVQSVLRETSLQTALSNSRYVLFPVDMQVYTTGVKGKWFKRNPYPNEGGFVHIPTGIIWLSGYCYNPVATKIKLEEPTVKKKRPPYTPPAEQEEEVERQPLNRQEQEQKQIINNYDYRTVSNREPDYERPARRERNPWNKHLIVDVGSIIGGTGNLLSGMGNYRIARKGLTTYNHNYNQTSLLGYIYHDGPQQEPQTPVRPRYRNDWPDYRYPRTPDRTIPDFTPIQGSSLPNDYYGRQFTGVVPGTRTVGNAYSGSAGGTSNGWGGSGGTSTARYTNGW